MAEKHYINGGDWKTAVNMYRLADMWDDSFRVAKQYGGASAAKQVYTYTLFTYTTVYILTLYTYTL